MEEFFESICMRGGGWRVVGVRKRALRSIRCGCEKGTIIGHLARKVSRVCSLFLRREGTIECNY